MLSNSNRKASPGSTWTLVLTAIAFFMVALDALVVVTALPAIQRDLHADLSTLEWTVNAFTLAYAAGITTAAALGDRFGRRRLFLLGLAGFSIASAGCALSPSAGVLIAARAIQGLGAAVIMPLSLTILVSAFPPQRRGAVVGIWGGIAGLAVAAGPLVGGAITQGFQWQWIFWLNVPIGLAAAVVSRIKLSESHGPATRLDLPAAALVSVGAIAMVWGLIRSGQVGWNSIEVVAALVAGVALIGAFIVWERGANDPMLPLRLFQSPAFTAANVTGFLMAGSLFAAAFLIAQYFQFGLGYSPLTAGLRLLPWTATPLLVAPLAGIASDRIGRRPLLITGLLLQAVALVWIAGLAGTNAPYGPFILPLLIAGIGIWIALPIAPAAVLSAVAPADMGKASGVNSTLQRLGSAFAIAVAAAVFGASGHLGSAQTFTQGFRPALAVVALLSALGAVSALAITARRVAPAASASAELAVSA